MQDFFICERYSYLLALCDCPGFGDTRSSTERVAQSILTEMMVASARSVKVAVLFKSDAMSGTGEPIRRVSQTLDKLIKTARRDVSILFLCNNHLEKASSVKQVTARVSRLREGHKKQFLQTVQEAFQHEPGVVDVAKRFLRSDSTEATITVGVARAVGSFFSEADKVAMKKLKNDPSVAEQMRNLESTWLLDFMSEKNIEVLNEFNEETRQRIRNRLKELPITDKKDFSFTGYNSDRIAFDDTLVKAAVSSTLILEARASVSRYQAMVQDLLVSVGENITHNSKEIKAVRDFLAGNEVDKKALDQARLAQIERLTVKKVADENKISDAEARIIKKNEEIAGCDKTDEEQHWQGIINKDWKFWSDWYPEVNIDYKGMPYSRVSGPSSNQNAKRIKDYSVDKEKGHFDVLYESASVGRCHGSVEIYVNHHKLPTVIKARMVAVLGKESIEKEIEEYKEEIVKDQKTVLELKASIGGPDKTKEQKEADLKKHEREKQCNEEKQKVYQGFMNRIGDIQKVYEQNRDSIDKCYKMSVMLETNRKPAVSKFMELYLQSGAEGGVVELPVHLRDQISFNVLLDPVLTQCNHVFNRVTIDALLNSGNTKCPLCRAAITKEGLRKMSFGDFVDEYVNKVASATEEAHEMLRSLNETRIYMNDA